MSSPWLFIPLEEYEGHMRSARVAQADALSGLFGSALELCRPESAAILGVAGGNGLERIDPAVTRRIVGVDINSAYLEATRRRYPSLPGLELHIADLAREALTLAPVDMVHAALVFEHAGMELCLENAVALVAPGGRLSAVLQLESASEPDVGESGYASIALVRDEFRLIPPERLRTALESRGFGLVRQERRELAGGKAFWLGIFAR